MTIEIEHSNEEHKRSPVPTEDWLLEGLVRIANNAQDFELPVTLVVNGILVTGKLIDLKQYFTLFGKWWNRTKDEAGGELQQYFQKMGEPPLEEEPASNPIHYNFVHLKDARFSGGLGLVPTDKGFLWRGRLAHVSGFSLGSMAQGPTTITTSHGESVGLSADRRSE